MIFHYINCNIISFFYSVKTLLEILQVLINVYDLYFILLYINIGFLIHNYIFYSMSKNSLITPTHLLFYIGKKLFNPQRGESNKCVNTFFFHFIGIDDSRFIELNACVDFSFYNYDFVLWKNTLEKHVYLFFLLKNIIWPAMKHGSNNKYILITIIVLKFNYEEKN